jgi:signal transduction histidine kinase
VTKPAVQGNSSGLRRPPQITLALDQDKRVLYINKDLAGTGFAAVRNDPGVQLHNLIHPDCDGQCRFNSLLGKAWKNLLADRQSVEWEIDDAIWQRHLRLHLSRIQPLDDVAVERRRRFAMLTITDITEIRREYESVLSSNKELLRRLQAFEGTAQPAANEALPSATSRASSADILAAQERERRRIAADLHDGVAQTMGIVKFSVESRITELKRRYPDLELSEFEQVVDQIREAIEDLRKISHNLSPAVLNEFGMCMAIDMLCKELASEIPHVEVVCSSCINEIGIPEVIKVAIYRVVQEALNNIGKHSRPQNITVSLHSRDGNLSLEIADDGAGFDAARTTKTVGRGLGLQSMQERVELTGGYFEIMSATGAGTTVRATWPESELSLMRDEPVLNSENGHR